jgi:tRNA U38,U39,U40 pseudouridine synthase TruA
MENPFRFVPADRTVSCTKDRTQSTVERDSHPFLSGIRCALDPSTLWVVPWVLDDSKLDEFCKELTGNHDYSVFVHKRARRDKSNVLTVDKLLCKTIFETEEAAPVLTVRFDVEAKVCIVVLKQANYCSTFVDSHKNVFTGLPAFHGAESDWLPC